MPLPRSCVQRVAYASDCQSTTVERIYRLHDDRRLRNHVATQTINGSIRMNAQLSTAIGKTVVVLATYNEVDNLRNVIHSLMRQSLPLDVLVVDDNSPDGTGLLADQLANTLRGVYVLHRAHKAGLADALRTGFQWALNRGYERVVNMDADLSHHPDEIWSLLGSTVEVSSPTSAHRGHFADVVVGSRYIGGIRVVNWPPRRLMLSLLAARFVRLVTGMPLSDPTSGFRCFRRRALEAILAQPVISHGYSFHIEIVHKAWRSGMKIEEVPIFYTERTHGMTKINSTIIIEALWITFRLLIQNNFSRRPASRGATLPDSERLLGTRDTIPLSAVRGDK